MKNESPLADQLERSIAARHIHIDAELRAQWLRIQAFDRAAADAHRRHDHEAHYNDERR